MQYISVYAPYLQQEYTVCMYVHMHTEWWGAHLRRNLQNSSAVRWQPTQNTYMYTAYARTYLHNYTHNKFHSNRSFIWHTYISVMGPYILIYVCLDVVRTYVGYMS